MSDKKLKSRAVLNLMSKIWGLKDSPAELKKTISLFGGLAGESEDFILYVLDYLESMRVITAQRWRDLEKELVLEGTFKKGGFMDIREEIRQKGRMEGRMEGRQEGMQQGQKQLILKLLEGGMDLQSICKYTGLSESDLKNLQSVKD